MRAPTISVRFQPNDMVSLAPESAFCTSEQKEIELETKERQRECAHGMRRLTKSDEYQKTIVWRSMGKKHR